MHKICYVSRLSKITLITSRLCHLTQDQQTLHWMKTLVLRNSQNPVLIGCQLYNFIKSCSHEDKARIEICIMWNLIHWLLESKTEKLFSAHLPLYLQLMNSCKLVHKDCIFIAHHEDGTDFFAIRPYVSSLSIMMWNSITFWDDSTLWFSLFILLWAFH